ncbi:MAG: histidinol-phosphate transaminase [Deltaproteobacteria bacterium RBG_16_48_10]|nr:MAG: histidinol-phosphate transaminase [Deltaproteobacteria bacterium RBG_16_48_10]
MEQKLKPWKLARKGILDLVPYIPGKTIEQVEREFGKKRWIKLASNENVLGPSPKAITAIRQELSNIHMYPEGACTNLRQALSRRFSISQDNIVVSNGSDNLLVLIASAFLNEREETVMATPTFPMYPMVTRIMGGRPIQVKLKNYTHDLTSMLKKVNQKTKLVFVSNPHNPTGTIVSQRELDAFLSNIPEQVILVLDEAYRDFADSPECPNGIDYVKEGRLVILLRTFSKVYGLAGLRIGYAIGRRDLIDYLYRVRDPFPTNRLGQAGAVAALDDKAHEKKSICMVLEGRKYLCRELDKMGLFYIPSQANFILLDLGRDSREALEDLLREGVIIRPGYIWGYPTFARVTVGLREQNKRFIKALKKVLIGKP